MDYLTGPEITHDASHHLWVCVGPNHSGGARGGAAGGWPAVDEEAAQQMHRHGREGLLLACGLRDPKLTLRVCSLSRKML